MATTRKSRFVLRPPPVLEQTEQAAVFQFAALQARRDARWGYLFAIPNGTSASSMAEAVKAKRTGRKKGVPDMFLPIPKRQDGQVLAYGLFIELKRRDGRPSDVAPEQADWLTRLAEQGYQTAVAYGWNDAVATIQSYLSPEAAP